MPTVQRPALGALPPLYQPSVPKPTPAVSGLNTAIGGPRAANPYGQPPAGGAGGPGDPAIWQQDPLGQKYTYNTNEGPGREKWIPVGPNAASEDAQAHARDLADEERRHAQAQADDQAAWQRQQQAAQLRRAQMLADIETFDKKNTPTTIPHVPVAGPGGTANDAMALAFARAKDQAGLATRGLLKSVQHNMAARGIGGSGIEGAQSLEAMAGGADRLAQVASDQATEEAHRAQSVEDRNYQGDIAQRQQDIAIAAQQAEYKRQYMAWLSQIYGGAY